MSSENALFTTIRNSHLNDRLWPKADGEQERNIAI